MSAPIHERLLGMDYSTSFFDAVHKKTVAWDSGKYDLAGNVAIGLAIGLGAWVLAFFVELFVWHTMTFNWRRLVCCGRGKTGKNTWFKPYNSTTEAEKRPYVLPVHADTPGATPHPLSTSAPPPPEVNKTVNSAVRSTSYSVELPPAHLLRHNRGLVRRIPVSGAQQQQQQQLFNNNNNTEHVAIHIMNPTTTPPDLVRALPPDQLQHYKVEPSQSSSLYNFYTGHERSRFESYARMTALLIRVVIVIAGIIAACSSAGINVISVVTGLGIVAIMYTYGAQPLVTNVCSSIYIHGSGRIDMLDYVVIGSFKGFVGSFNAQFIELIDDLSPWTWGPRRIAQVPTGMFSNTPFSALPNGPPPMVIAEYMKELAQVNEQRKQLGIAGMVQPISEIQLWMDPRYMQHTTMD